jgi:hypothetical protein
MKPTLCLAAALVAVALVAAHAQTGHDASATSSAHVETVKTDEGGTAVVMKVHNARFVPYYTYAADNDYPARLVTIVTDVLTRSDREGPDPSSTVSVTVDDLSGKEPKRLAAFSDPGDEGEVIVRRYFASTMPGCCDSPAVHRVRALETGRSLFRSTGPGDVGSVAWAEVPNARPAILRWAAFDGDLGDEQFKAGVLGFITYGGDDGATARVRVATSAGEDEHNDLWEGLAHGASLVWVDPKKTDDAGGESQGEAESPTQLWSLDGLSDPTKLGGFRLALMLDKKRLALIPIMGDRLAIERATLAPKLSLAPAQP